MPESQPLLPHGPHAPLSDGRLPAGKPSNTSPSRFTARGFLYMVLSTFFMSLFSFFAHVSESSFGFSVPSVLLVRGCISLSFSLIYILSTNLLSTIEPTRDVIIPLLIRGVSGSMTGFLVFSAVARIPVGTAMTLFNVAPTFTSVAAALVFSEAFTRAHALNLVANFFGVMLVSGMVTNAAVNGTAPSAVGVMFGLGSAISSTVNVMVLRKLGARRMHPMMTTFAYGAGCLVLLLFIATKEDVHAVVSGNRTALMFAVLSALFGFIAQNLLALGLRHVPAGAAAVVRSLNVPMSFALGLVALGETIAPLEAVGVVLIVGSVTTVGMMKR